MSTVYDKYKPLYDAGISIPPYEFSFLTVCGRYLCDADKKLRQHIAVEMRNYQWTDPFAKDTATEMLKLSEKNLQSHYPRSMPLTTLMALYFIDGGVAWNYEADSII